MPSRNAAKNTLRILARPDQSLALQAFLLDRQAANLSPRTLDFYRQKLAPFLDFLERRGVAIAQIAPDDVRAFLVALQETHAPGGVHAYFRAIRAFCRYLHAEGEIAHDPMARVKPPRVDLEPLAPADLGAVKAILSTCNVKTEIGARDKAIVLALLDSGLRAGEFLALNVGDLDMTTGALTVRHSKSRRARVTFLGAKARREILRYLAFRQVTPASPLWATLDGKRLSYTGLRDILRRRAKQAGVPAPTLHSFRRAFALLSLRAGADLVSLQRLLGHADLSVIRRYLKQTESDLQAAHAKAAPVDKWL